MDRGRSGALPALRSECKVSFDWRPHGLAGPMVLWLASCSLAQTDLAACSDSDCRDAFGFGYLCGPDLLCEKAPPEPRCTQSFPDDFLLRPEAYPRALVVGSLFDRSLVTHQARENAIRLAFRTANDEGGLEGRPFAAVFCNIDPDPQFDGLERTEAAVAMARYLVQVFGVRAILGPAASQDTLAVAEDLKGSDVVVISPSATSPVLTEVDPFPATDARPGLLWRTAPPDSLQGISIAEDMRSRQPQTETSTRVTVIYETGPYGEFLAGAFEERFSVLGGITTRRPFDTQAALAEAVVRTVAASPRPDEVLFVSSQTPDVISFLQAVADNRDYDGLRLFLTDSGANRDVLESADPAVVRRIRGTRQAPLDDQENFVFSLFLTTYASAYGDDARQYSFVANAFDAAWMVAYGMAWAQYQSPQGPDVSGTAIARGLRRLSSGPAVQVQASSWETVKAQFAAGSSIDIMGASSDLDFDPSTEEFRAPIEVWTVQDGEIAGIRLFNSSSD